MDTVLGVEYNGGGRYLWRLYFVRNKRGCSKGSFPTTNGGLSLSALVVSVRVDFVVLLCHEEENSSLTLCVSLVSFTVPPNSIVV